MLAISEVLGNVMRNISLEKQKAFRLKKTLKKFKDHQGDGMVEKRYHEVY